MMCFIKRLLQKIRYIDFILLYKIYCFKNVINDKKVLFLSSSRDTLTGNFLYVYNEIEKRKKYEINYILKKNLKSKFSFNEKRKLAKLISMSKYIFVDDFCPIIYTLKLRKKTNLIQLWHAMGAFKKVGYSREKNKKAYSLTHRNYTAAIVSSESIRKNYAEAFGISVNKVHALGIPRTDIFFDDNYKNNVIDILYKKYPVLKRKKVILFAPTFRGSSQNNAYYDFSCFDFKRLSDIFSKDYVCIYKLHPFIKNRPEYDLENDKFYLDLSNEREINDLLFITDILITDYSSVIFEYSFFKKPVIFYMPDLDDYKNSRDFYYPLSKYTYGPVVKNFDNLIEEIRNEKIDLKKLKEFNTFFCSSCVGDSSKKVVDYFLGK